MLFKRVGLFLFALISLLGVSAASASETSRVGQEDPNAGRLIALALSGHAAIKVDGSFTDWDLSQCAMLWDSPASADRFNANVALMVDADALYLAARVSLPGRPLHNPNAPSDSFELGDLFRLHLISDPSLPWPVPSGDPRFTQNPHVLHCSFWKDTVTGLDHVCIDSDSPANGGRKVDPTGAQSVVKAYEGGYLVEARLPWTLLQGRDGHNPFRKDQKMTALVETLWTVGRHADGVYNPASGLKTSRAASLPSWGQVEFSLPGAPASHPAARELAEGDQALFRGVIQEAEKHYGRAQSLLSSGPAASEAVRRLVQIRNTQALLLESGNGHDRLRELQAFRLLTESSDDLRYLGLVLLSGLNPEQANVDDTARRNQALQRMRKSPLKSGPVNARLRLLMDRAALENAAALGLREMALAVQAERKGDLRGAYPHYKTARSLTASPQNTTNTELLQVHAAAARSVELLERINYQPPTNAPDAPNAFLGVDTTLGGDWNGQVGTEAWALFGLLGEDLCGGPALLKRAFTYDIRNPDPAAGVPRWNDGQDFPSRLRGDLALAAPSFPPQYAIAFANDNGQIAPPNCGPDLTVDLTIPPGAHVLSIPLHFSNPADLAACYGFYLFERRQGAAEPCVATRVVHVAEAPGYLRLRIQGGKRYRLWIRRLSSLNANLPALFLDAAPVMEDSDRLHSAFSREEWNRSGLGDETAGDVRSQVLRSLCAEYEALQRAAGTADKPSPEAQPQSRPGSAEWTKLADRASALAHDPGLAPLLRAVAAWLAWQSTDRCLLRTGEVAEVYDLYLTERCAAAPPESRGRTRTDLRQWATAARQKGRLRLAEKADSQADEIEQVEINAALPTDSNLYYPAMMKARETLWQHSITPYLAPEVLWMWRGEGHGEPTPLVFALDVDYAATRVRHRIEDMVGNTPLGFDHIFAQNARLWIDWFATLKLFEPDRMVSPSSGQRVTDFNQPVRSILYAAACEPLLGNLARIREEIPSQQRLRLLSLAAAPRNEALKKRQDSPPPAAPFACLLSPWQQENLADAWISWRIFPGPERTNDLLGARRLLIHLLEANPAYSNAARARQRLSTIDVLLKP